MKKKKKKQGKYAKVFTNEELKRKARAKRKELR